VRFSFRWVAYHGHTMIEDAELLRRYADDGSEQAFTELVQRHLPLVYACALRRVHGDAQLAEDVAQQVFTDVARRATQLARYPILAGWLFTSTRFTAAKAIRTVRRRLNREQEAHLMHALSAETEIDWERARPLLDDAIAELGARDREALLLRFFEARDYATIGSRLEISDNAARMRVERALEKLRVRLNRRGLVSTTAVLATVLAQQAAVAVPVGVAASVTGAALAGGGVGALTLATAFSLMSATKLQIAVASVLVVAGTATLTTGQNANAALRAQISDLQPAIRDLGGLRRENERLQQITDEVAALRADAGLLQQLQTQAADLRSQLRSVSQPQPKAAAVRKALPSTTQVLAGLGPLLRDKRYADALPTLDALIAVVPPESYDLAVLLEAKARLCFALQDYPESLVRFEKAIALAEQHDYFTGKQLFEARLMVAALRYQQKLATNVPTPWFWDVAGEGLVIRQPQ
jgi:RNA polymerase sigma factor (sigma-70 family)